MKQPHARVTRLPKKWNPRHSCEVAIWETEAPGQLDHCGITVQTPARSMKGKNRPASGLLSACRPIYRDAVPQQPQILLPRDPDVLSGVDVAHKAGADPPVNTHLGFTSRARASSSGR